MKSLLAVVLIPVAGLAATDALQNVLVKTGANRAVYRRWSMSETMRLQKVDDPSKIIELTVDQTIKEIPKDKFADMTNLRYLRICGDPKIHPGAFAKCPKLECVHADSLDRSSVSRVKLLEFEDAIPEGLASGPYREIRVRRNERRPEGANSKR